MRRILIVYGARENDVKVILREETRSILWEKSEKQKCCTSGDSKSQSSICTNPILSLGVQLHPQHIESKIIVSLVLSPYNVLRVQKDQNLMPTNQSSLSSD